MGNDDGLLTRIGKHSLYRGTTIPSAQAARTKEGNVVQESRKSNAIAEKEATRATGGRKQEIAEENLRPATIDRRGRSSSSKTARRLEETNKRCQPGTTRAERSPPRKEGPRAVKQSSCLTTNSPETRPTMERDRTTNRSNSTTGDPSE